MLKKSYLIFQIFVPSSTIFVSCLISYLPPAIGQIATPVPGGVISAQNVFNPQGSIVPYGYNNDLLSTITIQSCTNGCLFFNAKNTSSSFTGNSTEITVGGVWQLGNSDSGRKELAHINNEPALIDAQNRQKQTDENIITNLRRELIEAISAKKISSGILIARQLAPKLGYKDHFQLLNELGLSRIEIEGGKAQN
jgi:hypothetical protein